MYSLYLADDEIIILRGLRKLLDWTSLDIKIVGEAVRGDKAEEDILRLRPDLALLDIRMPVKTGLDILHKIKEKGIDTKVVFLSGHEEFNYVQDALTFGAQNYLLKPVKEEELLQAVTSALQQIDKNVSANAAITKISRMEQNEALLNKLNEDCPCFTALAVHIHDFDFMDYEMEKLLLFSVFHLLEQKIRDKKQGVIFLRDNLIHIILNHTEDIDFPKKTARELCGYVKSGMDKKILTGVGITVNDIAKVSQSINTAREALNYRFVRPNDTVFLFEPSNDTIIEVHRNEQIQQIMEYINVHYAENITLERIAKIAYMNPYYLSAYFKKNTGLNFKDFLTRNRMEHAVFLLHNEDLKTYELAERVGFTDARYFSELFKRSYGKTPLEFKRDKKNKGTNQS
jgi:two-component system response regulator YesN